MMALIANIHIAELTKWSFFDYVQTLYLIFSLKTKTCFSRSTRAFKLYYGRKVLLFCNQIWFNFSKYVYWLRIFWLTLKLQFELSIIIPLCMINVTKFSLRCFNRLESTNFIFAKNSICVFFATVESQISRFNTNLIGKWQGWSMLYYKII